MEDFKVSGSGNMIGGEYGNIRISGACKISGDISCQSIHISGSTKTEGNIVCKADAHISGAFKGKDLSCSELKVSGSSKFGAVKGSSIKVSGAMTADSVEAENVSISGKTEIQGLLNAEKIQINAGAKVGSIGCTELTANTELRTVKILWGLIEFNNDLSNGLKAEVIEGDRINICYTEAETVRGADITIGKGCKIGRVEYTNTCTVDAEASVKELVKTS